MTLADAIAHARRGEDEGLACLFAHTVPHIWMMAAVLGCPQVGTVVTRIYRRARDEISSLRSPSDLRVWIGRIAFDELLRQPDGTGCAIAGLSGDSAEAYRAIASLPRGERAALLLLCGDGCSAPQAAQILSQPEIEVKRAMRRARQTVAAHMKQAGCTQTCNTAWLIAVLDELCRAQTDAAADERARVLACVRTGEPYREPAPVLPEQTAPRPEEEKPGFFQKWFRSRRFG
ncbi:MAG TPA: hypothetical protein IAA32_08420 [Candidatus Butyricicoccus stercorigallinarum]|nr:hypothetical protein [Candidatus Butyricicoccus stercorigallinarum]